MLRRLATSPSPLARPGAVITFSPSPAGRVRLLEFTPGVELMRDRFVVITGEGGHRRRKEREDEWSGLTQP